MSLPETRLPTRAEVIKSVEESGTDKCYLCQKNPPTWKATRSGIVFLMCGECVEAARLMNDRNNRIKQALRQGQAGKMFEMTLGADLSPVKITFEEIK